MMVMPTEKILPSMTPSVGQTFAAGDECTDSQSLKQSSLSFLCQRHSSQQQQEISLQSIIDGDHHNYV